jgi:hypothetical protein
MLKQVLRMGVAVVNVASADILFLIIFWYIFVYG